MRWHHALTSSQRKILLGLAGAVFVVISLLAWSVWSTLRISPSLSPLPTPTLTTTPSPSPTATPTATSTPTPTPTPTPTFDVAEAGQIAADVVDARGILARWSTPLTLVDAFELSNALHAHYQTYPPLGQQDHVILTALGIDMGRVKLDVVKQTGNVAALYIPEEAQIYLRRDWYKDIETIRLQLAYGYARALTDQHGDLPHLIVEASSLDQRLALKAVGQGDALFALWRYANVAPDSSQAAALTDMIAQATLPLWQPPSPPLHNINRLPLDIGLDFATARYTTGRLNALNDALRRPPRSTEQILHPSHYANGDEPIHIQPLVPTLESEWVLTRTETLGEALLGRTISIWSAQHYGPNIVADWGGDLLQIWQGPDGGHVLLWHTVWDTWQAAGRFHAVTHTLLPQHMGGQQIIVPTPPALAGGRWWVSRKGAAYIRRDRRDVWLVWGDNPATVEAIANAVNQPLPVPRPYPPDHRSLLLEP